MKNGFYEELEKTCEYVSGADFGFLENIDVTNESNAFNFLHGSCAEFAAMLSEIYGYQIECIRNGDGRLAHAYCITEIDGVTAYVDIRGTTTNKELFFSEFENDITYYPEDDSFFSIDEDGYEVEVFPEIYSGKDDLFEGEFEGWSNDDIKRFIRDRRNSYSPNNITEITFDAENLTLYRYELYCEDEPQDVGFIMGINDLCLSTEKEENLLFDFNMYLDIPDLPEMRNSVSFFTDIGNKKFNHSIRSLITAYKDSVFDVKLVTLKLPLSMKAKMIYQDDNQVVLLKDVYYGELGQLKEITTPKFENLLARKIEKAKENRITEYTNEYKDKYHDGR